MVSHQQSGSVYMGRVGTKWCLGCGAKKRVPLRGEFPTAVVESWGQNESGEVPGQNESGEERWGQNESGEVERGEASLFGGESRRAEGDRCFVFWISMWGGLEWNVYVWRSVVAESLGSSGGRARMSGGKASGSAVFSQHRV